MDLFRFGIFCWGLKRIGGERVLVFTLLTGIVVFVLVFGSLVGAIAHDRTRSLHPLNRPEPQRQAEQVRKDQLRQLGLERQHHQTVTRDWEQLRKEQLRQLGLDRQGKPQN